MKTTADKLLLKASKTYGEKSKEYGDNYLRIGHVLAAMFPQGVKTQSAEDWNRLHLLIMILVKVTRYSENWSRGGHQDSLHDLQVYAAMLEATDVTANT